MPFPTGINLLYDAIRTLIQLCAKWNGQQVLPGWRNHESNRRQVKTLYRKLQKLKHSTSKNEAKKAAKELEIKPACQTTLIWQDSILTALKPEYWS